jgi:hypothetical protein
MCRWRLHRPIVLVRAYQCYCGMAPSSLRRSRTLEISGLNLACTGCNSGALVGDERYAKRG